MKRALIPIVVVAAIIVAAGGKFVSVRNELIGQREAIDAQWSQVAMALERRADLAPNLAAPVQALAAHETKVFKDIADARTALANGPGPQEKLQANAQLSAALARLLVLAENYPQLKSNENFLRMQDEIAGAENRIAQERRKYNEALEHYNAGIQQFPANVVAGLSGLTRDDAYFKTEPGALQAPHLPF